MLLRLPKQLATRHILAIVPNNAPQPTRCYAGGHGHHLERWPPLSDSLGREMAGNREYVGYFLTGDPVYADRLDMPYPAIRFQKEEGAILQLREKEKSDWHKLSLEEKKALYRHSFSSTLVEVLAPKGYWKVVLGIVLIGVSASAWLMMLFQKYCTDEEVPIALSNAHKERWLKQQIDSFNEPITGVASKWDYENDRWKA